MAENSAKHKDREEDVAGALSFPEKDHPTDATGVMMGHRGHVTEPPESYENIPLSESPSAGQPAEAGHMHVPDDDMAGEGWAPPTERGGGWEHPAEVAKEDSLDQREGE